MEDKSRHDSSYEDLNNTKEDWIELEYFDNAHINSSQLSTEEDQSQDYLLTIDTETYLDKKFLEGSDEDKQEVNSKRKTIISSENDDKNQSIINEKAGSENFDEISDKFDLEDQSSERSYIHRYPKRNRSPPGDWFMTFSSMHWNITISNDPTLKEAMNSSLEKKSEWL